MFLLCFYWVSYLFLQMNSSYIYIYKLNLYMNIHLCFMYSREIITNTYVKYVTYIIMFMFYINIFLVYSSSIFYYYDGK